MIGETNQQKEENKMVKMHAMTYSILAGLLDLLKAPGNEDHVQHLDAVGDL